MQVPEDVVSEIKRKLRYDHVTGDLFWKQVEPIKHGDKTYNASFAGKVAGTTKKGKRKQGYREVHIKGKIVSCHKLAWFLHYGEWPSKEIDHINHDRGDNRIANLRLVSRSEQNRSACRRKDNTSGVTGVYYYKRNGKWLATINYNKKTEYLGYHEDFNDAVKAREEAEELYGFSPTHGKQLSKHVWKED